MRTKPDLRKSSEKPSAIFATGKPLVLVVTIVPGLRMASTLLQQRPLDLEILDHRFDDPVHFASLRSSSKLPTVTSRASHGSKKAAGLDFFAASSPAAAILFRVRAIRSRRNDIEQIAGHSGIGKMRGDACAHGSGAKNSNFVDAFHRLPQRSGNIDDCIVTAAGGDVQTVAAKRRKNKAPGRKPGVRKRKSASPGGAKEPLACASIRIP